MREIYYNSDITPKVANEIKLLALYYDKINIVNDAVYSPTFKTTNGKFEFAGTEELQFIPKSFRTDYKLLIDENILTITTREDDDSKYEKLFTKKLSQELGSSFNYIFPQHPTKKDTKIITEEVYDVMKYMVDFEWGKPIEADFVRWYYSLKLKWFIKLLMQGQNCLSSSNNLNHLFLTFVRHLEQESFDNGGVGHSKSLAFDALKIALPNPDVLSLEDILELKAKLRDELSIFYQTINALEVKNKQLFATNTKQEDYDAVFYSEIQKPLRELETKMKNLKSKTFRRFVDIVKEPKTYVPLIGTVVASIPMQYAVVASLGLTAGQTYLEFKEEQRDIRDNGLYFLLKLRQ
jgi:hypothetical protein